MLHVSPDLRNLCDVKLSNSLKRKLGTGSFILCLTVKQRGIREGEKLCKGNCTGGAGLRGRQPGKARKKGR